MKYAISSYQASLFSPSALLYYALRSIFERSLGKVPFLSRLEPRFNDLLLRLGRSAMNQRLVGPGLFDAVELHLTDPRMFYNPAEWKINEKMIGLVKGPIASFHAHVESNPLLRKYAFDLADALPRTRKAIVSHLKTGYKIMHLPGVMVAEDPVFVFHAGLLQDEGDRESALGRMRASLELIAATNEKLYREYGRGRHIIPSIENTARDEGLCQTIAEWKRALRGFESDIKLTLDFGHLQTVSGQEASLLQELRQGTMGRDIVNLHLHYSPGSGEQVHHAHAPLSKIPEGDAGRFRSTVREIVDSTGVGKQGFITLEVPSRDPADYLPAFRHLKRWLLVFNKLLRTSGALDWSAYRGTFQDQLDSLRIAREIVRA